MTHISGRPRDAAQERSEMRRSAGAYFATSGWLTAVAIVLQVAVVSLATLPALRLALGPVTNWLVLGLALTAPFARSLADETKRTADGILRRLEISDALGVSISRAEAEEVNEDVPAVYRFFAGRQALNLKPYASDLVPGPARLVENVRESAWWSARLARELARWEALWAVVLILACFGALYHFATSSPTTATAASAAGTRDAAEFAAALLVFIFAEGFLRRSREFKAFARESDRVVGHTERLRVPDGTPPAESALLVAMDYYLARQTSPRLSTIWYHLRKDRLNAKWDAVHADDRGRLP